MNIPIEKQIWSANEVAEYLKVTPRQVRERYQYREGFPRSIKLGVSKGSPVRWRASDIISWVESWG